MDLDQLWQACDEIIESGGKNRAVCSLLPSTVYFVTDVSSIEKLKAQGSAIQTFEGAGKIVDFVHHTIKEV